MTARGDAMKAAWGKSLAPDMFAALTLRQPWAWAVVDGGKDVENRRWSTSFRGEFLIHAAKGMTRKEYESALYWIGEHVPRALPLPNVDALERGGIVGVACLVDVLPPCVKSELFEVTCDHRWHMHEQYGFRLADVRPMPFVPWKGALGFFGVPRSAVTVPPP